MPEAEPIKQLEIVDQSQNGPVSNNPTNAQSDESPLNLQDTIGSPSNSLGSGNNVAAQNQDDGGSISAGQDSSGYSDGSSDSSGLETTGSSSPGAGVGSSDSSGLEATDSLGSETAGSSAVGNSESSGTSSGISRNSQTSNTNIINTAIGTQNK